MDEPRKRLAAEMSGLAVHYDLGGNTGTGDLDKRHPLLGRRMPDLDLVTANGSLRVFTLLHAARPVLLNFGEPGGFDAAKSLARDDASKSLTRDDASKSLTRDDASKSLTRDDASKSLARGDASKSPTGNIAPWTDRVQLLDAKYVGVWELPALGPVAAPTAVLIRPDGYVAWVGDVTQQGLVDALTTWFGPPAAA
jgi:3-(3-hydroxy-phenyl)propionate hydroxylase